MSYTIPVLDSSNREQVFKKAKSLNVFLSVISRDKVSQTVPVTLHQRSLSRWKNIWIYLFLFMWQRFYIVRLGACLVFENKYRCSLRKVDIYASTILWKWVKCVLLWSYFFKYLRRCFLLESLFDFKTFIGNTMPNIIYY